MIGSDSGVGGRTYSVMREFRIVAQVLCHGLAKTKGSRLVNLWVGGLDWPLDYSFLVCRYLGNIWGRKRALLKYGLECLLLGTLSSSLSLTHYYERLLSDDG
ncbi:hypothetical protein L2E82_45551 [Cichorium intybus]|uniref:Uncharacterized protein n=1 Tax=Cichorium intybus TaxID=13427 RepID=A0ACB8ZTB3_CICIN|nr:hypothetical protein L2E82_45551 [Cichorium intybus]